jgi:hypothetical protein
MGDNAFVDVRITDPIIEMEEQRQQNPELYENLTVTKTIEVLQSMGISLYGEDDSSDDEGNTSEERDQAPEQEQQKERKGLENVLKVSESEDERSKAEIERFREEMKRKDEKMKQKHMLTNPEQYKKLQEEKQANYEKLKSSLPPWQQVVENYGRGPVILGMDRCQAYRDAVPPEQRVVGPSGMFSTGTNLFFALFIFNCRPAPFNVTESMNANAGRRKIFKRDGTGNAVRERKRFTQWQAPWGKRKCAVALS